MMRKEKAVGAFIFSLAVAAGVADAQTITCANVKCAPRLMCVEKGPKRCVPIPQPAPEEEGERKVRDLELFACVNGLDNKATMDFSQKDGGGVIPKTGPGNLTKPALQALGCLKAFGYFERAKPIIDDVGDKKVCAQGGPIPKCLSVKWDARSCRWVCGKKIPSR